MKQDNKHQILQEHGNKEREKNTNSVTWQRAHCQELRSEDLKS